MFDRIKRLLTTSVLFTAGTVGVVLLSASATNPITAMSFAVGGINSLMGILGGVIANDGSVVWDKIGDRLQDNDKILQNNDLKKAVGIAIAAIIAQTAKDNTKIERAYQKQIKNLGKYTAENWLDFWKNTLTISNNDDLTAIQEGKLSNLMLQTSSASVTLKVFDKDERQDQKIWREILDKLCVKIPALMPEDAQRINIVLNHLAEALSHNFLKALREVLKEDFANGGKAFAGFTIDLFKELQQGINEGNNLILEKLDNLTINNTGEDSKLLTELAKLYNCAVENNEEIKNKLNGEFNKINQQLTAL